VEERERTGAIHGRNPGLSIAAALHKPSNKHAAPTELEKGPTGGVGYRRGAARELSNRFAVFNLQIIERFKSDNPFW